MKLFLPQRDMFLNEMIRRDGRGHNRNEMCPECPDQTAPGKAVIRCMGCTPAPLRCEACTVRAHALNPYHRVKVSYHVFSNIEMR